MRNNINRNVVGRRNKLVAVLLFALAGAASLAAQDPRQLTTLPKPSQRVEVQIIRRSDKVQANGVADGPTRIKITARAKGYPSVSPEFDLTGANGIVTGVSATSERKTFTFEQEAAGLSCPRSKVKECDALKLKDGGSLTACVCLVPNKGTSSPASGGADPASAEMHYDLSLSDGTTLRSTGGGTQTCWVNKKLQTSLCY